MPRFNPAFTAPIYSGYLQGEMSQQEIQRAKIANAMSQLGLQDEQDLRRASLGGLMDQGGGMDPTGATIAALSGNAPQPGIGAGSIPAVSTSSAGGPYMSPSMQATGGGPPGMQNQSLGLQTSLGPTGATAALPPQSAAAGPGGVPAAQSGAGAPSLAPSPSSSPAGQSGLPAGIPGMGMSLGQMLRRLKADPRNNGIPDTTLLGLATKAQAVLNPDDRILLQYMLKQNAPPTQYQQEQLNLSRDRLKDAQENRDATNQLRITLANMGMDKAAAGKWSVQQDMGNGGHSFRYNVETGVSTELDGKTPYTPSGSVAKQASGTQPRSAPAMAMQKFMQEHPNATAEDISNFGAGYGAKAKAARDFGTGPLGNSVRSINAAVQHLETARQAGTALANGDTQALNKLKNSWSQQFGSPLPTNFDAIRQIVGQEVVKAIVAGGGGVSERNEAKEILSRASSPQQLAGAIDQIQKLMAGQLNSLRQQYQRTVGLDDFDKRFLLPEAAKAMQGAGYEQGGAAPSGGDGGGWKIEPVQ